MILKHLAFSRSAGHCHIGSKKIGGWDRIRNVSCHSNFVYITLFWPPKRQIFWRSEMCSQDGGSISRWVSNLPVPGPEMVPLTLAGQRCGHDHQWNDWTREIEMNSAKLFSLMKKQLLAHIVILEDSMIFIQTRHRIGLPWELSW